MAELIHYNKRAFGKQYLGKLAFKLEPSNPIFAHQRTVHQTKALEQENSKCNQNIERKKILEEFVWVPEDIIRSR